MANININYDKYKKRFELSFHNLIELNFFWDGQKDFDVALFYQTRDGYVNGVFSAEYSGRKESEGYLEKFPYIKHICDWSETCSEQMRISSLQEMTLISVCVIDYDACINKEMTNFSEYECILEILNDNISIHSIEMNNPNLGNIYLICRITSEDGCFWLEEINDVLCLEEAYNSIPGFSTIVEQNDN